MWMQVLSSWRSLRHWVSCQSRIFLLFLSVFLFGLSLLGSSVACGKPNLSQSDRVALFVGLFGGAVVWWQGYLITTQMILGTVVDLYKEWNSEHMLEKRSDAWTNEEPNPETIEGVLEFMEKVSTLQRNRFVTQRLIWDTFGWYLGRYYFYSKNIIE